MSSWGIRRLAAALVVALIVPLAGVALGPLPAAQAATATLTAGKVLRSGASLTSRNGDYAATMRRDGALVVRKLGSGVTWSSRTRGNRGARLVLRANGNADIVTTSGRKVWSTKTARALKTRLVMRNDGRLVLLSRGGVVLWSSRGGRTPHSEDSLAAGGSLSAGQSLWARDGSYRAVMQGDGNFVVYAIGGGATYSTRTSVSGSSVSMQTDGNLVVYAPGGVAKWSSETAPARAARLVMQRDGNLVLYSRGGLALWSSKGGRTSNFEHVLPAGATLRPGQSLWANDGSHRAVMQGDGNFVVYESGGGATYATHTDVGGSRLAMQTDGNLVVYSPSGAARWSSDTAPARHARLVMQTDGNLVMYSRGGLPLWASKGGRTGYRQDTLPTGTRLRPGQSLWSTSGEYTAVMQNDGNFVVYRSGGMPIYATGTGVPNSTVAMQGDGNLVVYTPTGVAKWASNTAGNSGVRLVMQDDGNLVLYSGGTALWSSKGGGAPGTSTGTGGYPDADAVKCGGKYEWCKGGVPYSVRRFYYRNCTDYVAWRKGMVHSQIASSEGGHARYWKEGWIQHGRSWGKTPRVGAVAWWGGTESNWFGHVAYVIAVNPDGSARVGQYNANGLGTYSEENVRADAYLY